MGLPPPELADFLSYDGTRWHINQSHSSRGGPTSLCNQVASVSGFGVHRSQCGISTLLSTGCTRWAIVSTETRNPARKTASDKNIFAAMKFFRCTRQFLLPQPKSETPTPCPVIAPQQFFRQGKGIASAFTTVPAVCSVGLPEDATWNPQVRGISPCE
jgi:hypothetical protein